MTTKTDYSVIEHLDFDIQEKPEDKCRGYIIGNKGTPSYKNNSDCPNSPKLMAVRSCCGQIGFYCIECYNTVCSWHTGLKHTSGRSFHRIHEDAGIHEVPGKPFSIVEFIK